MSFARSNNAVVIAEGVENELVSDQIRSLNIPLGQGFGLGRPTIAADVLDATAAWNARDTLRPLRPRKGQARLRGTPVAHTRDVSEGSERRQSVPGNARRSGDITTPRLVRRSDNASAGRAS